MNLRATAREFILRLLGVNERGVEVRSQLARTGVLLYEIDLKSGKYLHLNGPVHALTGWTRSEFTSNQWDLIHPDDRKAFWIEADSVRQPMLVDRTARFLRADGTYMWLRDLARIRLVNGRPILLGLSVDVSASQAELLQMRRRATVDALTGVGNRFALLDELAQRLDDSRYGAHDFALFMIDFNRLKEINDRFGHAFGDAVLQQFAARVDATLRPLDVVARLGGDEFAVLAAGVSDVDEVKKVAERIVECTELPFEFEGVEVHGGVAIGAVLSNPDLSADDLLASADRCMYASKRGSQPFVIGSARRDGEAAGFSLSVQVESALTDGQFMLLFQPKVDLETRQVVGFEGLSRWQHPTLGVLEPSEFIHLLSQTDSVRAHTDHVFAEGLAFVAQAAANGCDTNIALNVSTWAMFDPTFSMRIRKALTAHEVNASVVTLEVTESDIMEDVADLRLMLEELDRLGVQVAIDDFGTGYSSLARLRDLPVAEIKIDRRFVANMVDHASDRVIVQSVCDLGRNLDLRVVAEGVEHESQVQALIEAGCGIGQGFLLGQPLTAEEALALLEAPHDASAKRGLKAVPDESPAAVEEEQRKAE